MLDGVSQTHSCVSKPFSFCTSSFFIFFHTSQCVVSSSVQSVNVKQDVAIKESQKVSQNIPSDSSLCVSWRSLPLGGALSRPSDQVAAGLLQVPLIPGEDPHTVLFGAEAQRVQLLQLRRHERRRLGSGAAIKIQIHSEKSESCRLYVYASCTFVHTPEPDPIQTS